MSRRSPEKAPRGRTLGREHQRCQGCGMRLTIGEPSPSITWPQRLNLSREQVSLLLEAAAEFEQLSEDAGIVSNAIDFCDWVSVDALRVTPLGAGRVDPPVLRQHDYLDRQRKAS